MSLFLSPVVRASDAANAPLSGAKWYFYRTGTTTSTPVYTSAALTTAHSDPVVADSGGLFAPIFLDPRITYRAVLKTSGGTTVQDIDPYDRPNRETAVNALALGAVADGTTDNHALVQAAIDAFGSKGGWLFFPKGNYYFSDRLKVTAPMRIEGEQNQRIISVDGATNTSLTVEQTLNGTLFKFAAGKGGIIFYDRTDSEDTPSSIAADLTANGVNSAYYQYAGGFDSILANITFLGQGGAAANGVEIRCRVIAENLYIRGFSQDAVHISASTGGSIGKFGNANDSRLDKVQAIDNGRDGFRIVGIDANKIDFISCKAQINDGYGFYEQSFLGNNYIGCHAATNALGTWYGHPDYHDNACHVLLGCYAESGTGNVFSMGYLTTLLGGNIASGGPQAVDSAAFSLLGGTATRRHFKHVNDRNYTAPATGQQVTATLGYFDASQTVMSFGASPDENATGDAWKFFYDGTNKCWNLRYAGSKTLIQYANNQVGNFRSGTNHNGYGPAFPGGFYFGGLGMGFGRKQHHHSGTAAPTTGTAEQGDVIWSSTPTAGGKMGWVCTAAGSPGTWKPFGPIDA